MSQRQFRVLPLVGGGSEPTNFLLFGHKPETYCSCKVLLNRCCFPHCFTKKRKLVSRKCFVRDWWWIAPIHPGLSEAGRSGPHPPGPLRAGADAPHHQKVRRRGIEPRPSAWKADILTTELTTLDLGMGSRREYWGVSSAELKRFLLNETCIELYEGARDTTSDESFVRRQNSLRRDSNS